MLTQLSIRNVVLIEKLDMDIGPSLSVLTGETGAGKSILLDSLSLGLGERGDASLLRPGADQASVTLTFALEDPHPAYAVLQELGLEAPEDALILRRTIGQDGRSRAFVNDQPVAVQALRKLGETLVDIHGQFETHGLLNRETHLGLLDSFADLEEDVEELGLLYSSWKKAEGALKEAQSQAAAAQKHAEDIRAVVEDLTKLSPQAGEAENLSEKRSRLQGREKIMEALQSAHATLQDEAGAAQKLAQARRILTRAAEKAATMLDPTLADLEQAENATAEAIAKLENLLHSDDFDAASLEKAEERLFALRAAARKYQCQPDDLPQLLEKTKEQAALLQNGAATLKKLEAEAAKNRKAFETRALSLHETRKKAASALEKAVQCELPPLKLESARFQVAVEPLDIDAATPRGCTRAYFMAAMNPGMPPAPLHKAASGGELARFMLALRLCLAQDADRATLVFDEVDSGIGGATASAVGERLARLGQKRQTLVVTHSPQVAARGLHHWRVEKNSAKNTTHTTILLLDAAKRREDVARMLSGDKVTDAARQAADSLLAATSTEDTSSKRRKAS
jgi:DNA repair protein RecN (Recombination protein N)